MTDKPEITARKLTWPVLMSEEQVAEAQTMRDMVTDYFATVTDPNYVPPPSWEGPPVTPVPEAYTRLLARMEPNWAMTREIVELHGPEPWSVATDGTVRRWVCEGCESQGYDAEYPAWPCETSKVIARHLGVEVTG